MKFKVQKNKLRNKTPVISKKQIANISPIEVERSSSVSKPPEAQSQVATPASVKSKRPLLFQRSKDTGSNKKPANDDDKSTNSKATGSDIKRMQFKIKQASPASNDNVFLKQGKQASKISPLKQVTISNKIKEMREKTMIRDNYNYFVGDQDYHTNHFLKFKKKHISDNYEKYLLSSASYSLRILIVLLSLISVSLNEFQGQISNFRQIKSDEHIQQQAEQGRWLKWKNLRHIAIIAVMTLSLLVTWPKFQKHFNCDVIVWRAIVNLVPVILSLNLLHYVSQVYSEIMYPTSEQEVTSLNQTLLFIMILIVKDLPLFFTSCIIVPDWMEYGAYLVICNVMYYFLFYPLALENQSFSSRQFTYYSMVKFSILIVIFSLFEKIRKEIFVIGLTNSKSKKQMMRMFNQISPTVIVTKEGNIQMCNEKFEQLLSEQIGIKQLPANIFKLVQNDPKAKNKLTEIIQSTATKTYNNQMMAPTKEFEMYLKKEPNSSLKKTSQIGSAAANEANPNNGEALDTNSNQKSLIGETFIEKFSAFKITVSSLQFKSQKQIMLNFESITNLKGKYQLMSLHTKHIGQSIISSQRRLEVLHQQLLSQNICDYSSQIGEFLGNSQVTFNMVQQMSHYLNYISNHGDFKIENYVLSEEIDYCLDGLTASKWEKEIEVFLTKGHLPKQVLGDLRKFRICLRSLLEFGIKYTSEEQMYVKCEFKEFTPEPERHFVIQFTVILAINPQYDLTPIEVLLSEQNDDENIKEQEDLSFDNQINSRYTEFANHIKDFGYGMVVFPSLVTQLNGSYFIEQGTTDDQRDSQTVNSNLIPQGKIKIGFKLPFEPAPAENVISRNNYKINPTREADKDGTQVFKTPQIKSGSRDISRNLSNMDSLMQGWGISSNGRSNAASVRHSGTLAQNKSGETHAAPSPASNNDKRTNQLMQVGNTNPRLQNYKFNQNGYASVNNQINLPKSNGPQGQTQPGAMQKLNINDDNIKIQGFQTGGLSRSQNINQLEESRAGSNNMVSSIANANLSSSGFTNAQCPPNQQPHHAISALDNSLKNLQNLQNTISEGRGKDDSQKIPSLDQSSCNKNSSGDIDQIYSQEKQLQNQNLIGALSQKRKYTRASLLKKISDEGMPQQFFGNQKPPNKNQYQSTSTAGFIQSRVKSVPQGQTATESSINYQKNEEKKGNDDNINENESSEQYMSGVQSSQKIMGSQSFGMVMNSKQNLKSDTPPSNEERKSHNNQKAFSFMESGIKPSIRESASNILQNAASFNQLSSFQWLNQMKLNNNSVSGPAQSNNGDQSLRNSESNFQGNPSLPSLKNSGKVDHVVGTVRSNVDSRPSMSKYMDKGKAGRLGDIKEVDGANNLQDLAVKDAAEDGGLALPVSVSMGGEINNQNLSKDEDLISEIKDRVDSLQNQSAKATSRKISSKEQFVNQSSDVQINDGESDAPFNFRMEHIDSFMIESEDAGNTYGSYRMRRESGEPPKQTNERSMPLSKMVRRQIFDNFAAQSTGASKNLLNQSNISSPKQDDIQLPINDVTQFSPKNQLIESFTPKQTEQRQNAAVAGPLTQMSFDNHQSENRVQELSKLSGQEKAKQQKGGSFMKAAVNSAKLQSSQVAGSQLNFMNLRSKNMNVQQKFTAKNESKEYVDFESQSHLLHDNRKLRKQKTVVQDNQRPYLDVWQKNTSMYPNLNNSEYDVQDRNQSLKILPQIIEELKIQAEQQDQQANSIQSPVVSQLGTPLGKQVMLIVEDNHFIREAIQQQLTHIGVDFEAAGDGQEATEMVESYLKVGKQFDVILMDLVMPVMNGYKATQMIRDIEKKYEITKKKKQYICGYSAQVGLGTEKKCFDSGMNDIVAKPMKLQALQRMLKENDGRKIIRNVSPISESYKPGTPIQRMNIK